MRVLSRVAFRRVIVRLSERQLHRNRDIVCEQLAERHYQTLVGRTVLVRSINGFLGDEGGSGDVHLNPPARVRIRETGSTERHGHWNGDYLDPIYDVEILDSRRVLRKLEGAWIYGPTWRSANENWETPCEQGDIVRVLP